MKKIVIITLSLLLIIPSIAYGDNSFTDIDSNAWYYEAVKKMIQYEIINGYDDSTFRPNNFVKRNEYAKMLVKSLKIPVDENSVSSFSDLPDKSWETKYVESAKYYLTGYKSSDEIIYKPNDYTLREDIMVALVKALNYDFEAADLSVLDAYEDADDISTNLKKYVAIAINKDIISGYTENNQQYIKPQKAITRAETATLLLKVITDEKITFDTVEKVTFDETEDPNSEPINDTFNTDLNTGVKIYSHTEDGQLLLKWEKNKHPDVKGYKIVATKNYKLPTYPKDGYYAFTTDHSIAIKAGSTYHNGSIDQFKSNEYYYFNVNTYYKDGSVKLSNTLKLKIPSISTDDSTDDAITLSGKFIDNTFVLEWDKYKGGDFKGYKVVASAIDSSPVYPDNGYYKYNTNQETTSISIPINASYNAYSDSDPTLLKQNEHYYFSITILKDNSKSSSNTVKILSK